MKNKKAIKVGLLLDSYRVPKWTKMIIELLSAADYVDIICVFVKKERKAPKGIFSKLDNFLYKVFTRIDEYFYQYHTALFRNENIQDILEDIPAYEVVPNKKGISNYFSDDDVDIVRKYNPDILLRFGFGIIKGEVIKVPELGVWSFHHGDNDVNRGKPAGFWEVMEQWDVTGATLQILNNSLDGGKVIQKVFTQTDTTSVARNKSRLYSAALYMVPDTIREINHFGKDYFWNKVENNNSIGFYSKPLYTIPGELKMMSFLFSHASRIIRRVLKRKIRKTHWSILYKKRKSKKGFTKEMRKLSEIKQPNDLSFADPHLAEKDGKTFMFFEAFSDKKKGRIKCLEFMKNGDVSDPVTVLEQPWHLSYPFVFRQKDNYYLIPESAENRTIDLYKAVDFPYNWERTTTLMSGVAAYDTTLFYHDDTWWMFTTIKRNEFCSSDDTLFLFYSDDVFGEWKSHPENPVSCDIRKSRCAGPVFSYNGRIYRPSQNSSSGYGGEISFNEIITIAKDSYKEKLRESIKPDWNNSFSGLHTFSFKNGLTVIDVIRKGR